ncbi:hypothetical protein MicloDRAFT_00011660 [Microvirga lotononidis]|uniref:Uncharacterized protein n=1 Tax=Microvirga lotononidis TaxID=864069 RepID=I4Z0V4_9HYPH|nr:hypothetical protein MicloDRAFT_00011660 [Microvirga lotononidis]
MGPVSLCMSTSFAPDLPLPASSHGTGPAAVVVAREVGAKAWVLRGRGNLEPDGGFPLKAKLPRPEAWEQGRQTR